MTTPFWCLVVVLFLPLLLAFVGASFRGKAFGTADNKQPRAQAARLDGIGARAYAAQENAWEAAILFSATILMTDAAGLSPSEAAPFALAFVGLRIVHGVSYLMDQDKIRSGSFVLGMICIITLLVKAA